VLILGLPAPGAAALDMISPLTIETFAFQPQTLFALFIGHSAVVMLVCLFVGLSGCVVGSSHTESDVTDEVDGDDPHQ